MKEQSETAKLLDEGVPYAKIVYIKAKAEREALKNRLQHRDHTKHHGLSQVGYILSCLEIKINRAEENKSKSTEIKAVELYKWFNELARAYEIIGVKKNTEKKSTIIKQTVYGTYQVFEPIGGKIHYETSNKKKAEGVLEYLKEKK